MKTYTSANSQPLSYLLGALQLASERKSKGSAEALIPTVKQTGR